ncbi:MAG TPA: hypothetical protein VEX68_30740 [Bryobacteraceae bacterium]|nr:hypothetical protein [Bryobacteraceae bacterium]
MKFAINSDSCALKLDHKAKHLAPERGVNFLGSIASADANLLKRPVTRTFSSGTVAGFLEAID